MTSKWARVILTIMFLLILSGVSHALTVIGTASYEGSDYKLIYEETQNLVWLDYANANYEFGYSGTTWYDHMDWASGLGESITVNLLPGFTTTIDWGAGWRLPEFDESKVTLMSPADPDAIGWEGPDLNGNYDYMNGYNMVNGEMGHLFYESLGNKGQIATDGTHPTDYGLLNTGEFENLMAVSYMSGTTHSPSPNYAWFFSFGRGAVFFERKADIFPAMAVHEGEVNFEPVPEPATLLIFGTGIIGILGMTKRKLFKQK